MAENDVVERAKRELRRRKALAEIQRRQSMSPQPEAEPQEHNFGVLPLKWSKEGELGLGVPRMVSGAIEGAKEAYSAPYRAYTGELPMTGPDGNTSEEAIAEAFNMATMVSPASTALRAGEKVIPGAATNLAPADPLSAQAIKQTARGQYDEAADLGVEFSPEALKNMSDDTIQKLFTEGFVAETAPRTTSLLKRVGDVPEAAADEVVSAPLSSVEAARRSFGKLKRNFNDQPDAEAARIARDDLDAFLRDPPEGAVLSGDYAGANQLYREADKNWASAKKSELLTDTEDAAALRAAAANSGQNAGNSTRQRIASLLLNPKTASRFNSSETEALESVVKGNRSENVTRYLGNLLGGGGGMAQALTALGTGSSAMMATGNPMALAAGAIPAVAGALLKAGSNAMTKDRLGAVEEGIRRSAPASRDAAEDIPAEVMRERAKEMVIRSLLMQKMAPEQDPFWDKWLAGDAA